MDRSCFERITKNCHKSNLHSCRIQLERDSGEGRCFERITKNCHKSNLHSCRIQLERDSGEGRCFERITKNCHKSNLHSCRIQLERDSGEGRCFERGIMIKALGGIETDPSLMISRRTRLESAPLTERTEFLHNTHQTQVMFPT